MTDIEVLGYDEKERRFERTARIATQATAVREVPTSIVDALDVAVTDALQVCYDRGSDETVVECLVCGEWEGHRDGCPIPAIQAWQAKETW